MSVYSRYKKSAEGFRSLVELWESTPISRRQKMIDVGRAEDPEYTDKVLKYMLTFEDVIQLPDLELAELIATAPARVTGYAIAKSASEVQARFLKNAKGATASEIRDTLESNVELRDVGGAQLKLVAIARQLEKKGLVKTKQIPLAMGS